MYETEGFVYWIWCKVWPVFRLVIWLRAGEFGLALPPSSLHEAARTWWMQSLWKSIRRVISLGMGGTVAISLGLLSLVVSVLLPVVPIILGLPYAWLPYVIFPGIAIGICYLLAVSSCYGAYL